MDFFAVEQDPFGKRGFPRIDMGADPDVAHCGNITRHAREVPPEIRGQRGVKYIRAGRGIESPAAKRIFP
jgi:hypothetical protein